MITLSISMKTTRIFKKDVVKLLGEKGPITTKEMMTELQCSRATLYTKLKDIPYITSGNKNGTYHALKNKAKYDKNGLWMHEYIVFSKWGTLENTIQHLIDTSDAGLHSSDLEEILKTKITPQLSALKKNEKIVQVRYGRHHVYYSADPNIKEWQTGKRNIRIEYPEAKITMSKEKIIQILSTILKYQTISMKDAVEILTSEGISVTEIELTWIFKKYDFKKL